MNTLLKLTCLALVAAPLAALAQSNEAFIEKSKIVGAGNELHLYGLPAKDSTGKIKYWDTTITLEIGPAGKPTATSATLAVPQAKAKSTEFVPGSYAGGGSTCSLVNSPFNGRTQFDLQCFDAYYNVHLTATWYTGAISGHPWEADLVAAQLDTVVGNQEYAWGKTLYDNGTTFFACFNDPELLSARQVGDTLTLVNYGYDKVVDCQISFNKTP